jgi:hypothetical protein
VPMTVGFANYFSLRLFGRRVYQDHYERPPAPVSELGLTEEVLE